MFLWHLFVFIHYYNNYNAKENVQFDECKISDLVHYTNRTVMDLGSLKTTTVNIRYWFIVVFYFAIVVHIIRTRIYITIIVYKLVQWHEFKISVNVYLCNYNCSVSSFFIPLTFLIFTPPVV